MSRTIGVCILICVFAVLSGCSTAAERAIDLPDESSIDRIELQYLDEGCTLSRVVKVKDDDRKTIVQDLNSFSEGKYMESVQDVPSDTTYIIISIYAKEHKKDKDVYLYRKDNEYYVEQPYIGIWKSTKEFYMRIKNYKGEV